MVSGYPAAAHKGHDTYASCVVKWQAHCQLGVHPHPVAPSQPVTSQTGKGKGASRAPRRSSSTPASHRASQSQVGVRGQPPPRRYYAIWGSGVVYSTKWVPPTGFMGTC
jgi:hypothetical protein